jgi:hypothetical protein
MRLSPCALFVAPRLCSTKTRRNKKSADNICQRQGGSSAREILLRVGRRKFCCVSVVGVVLSSAFVAVQTPTKEGRRKRHFRRRSRLGVPTPMNADNEVSVRRSGGGRLRYGRFGGEAQDASVLPVAGGFERGVPVAGGSETGGSDGGWTQAHCNNKAPPSLCCVLLLMATTRRNKKSPEHRAGNLFGRIRTSSSLVSRPTLLTTVE